MDLIGLKKIKGFKAVASNGEIGSVDNFLFDDESFVIRYVVINTGNWLMRNDVLVSPRSINKIDVDRKQLSLNITKEQVEKSPDIDTHKPVSRRMELEFDKYYTPMIGPYGTLGGMAPGYFSDTHVSSRKQSTDRDSGESQLRSTKEVAGYRIKATDKEFGVVEDFLIDRGSWSIRYFVVDTIKFWPSKWVIVSFECVTNFNWRESLVTVNLPSDAIQAGTEYSPDMEIPHELEESFLQHQGRPHYWKPSDRITNVF